VNERSGLLLITDLRHVLWAQVTGEPKAHHALSKWCYFDGVGNDLALAGHEGVPVLPEQIVELVERVREFQRRNVNYLNPQLGQGEASFPGPVPDHPAGVHFPRWSWPAIMGEGASERRVGVDEDDLTGGSVSVASNKLQPHPGQMDAIILVAGMTATDQECVSAILHQGQQKLDQLCLAWEFALFPATDELCDGAELVQRMVIDPVQEPALQLTGKAG